MRRGLAGFSVRHFRRIIDDERIRIVQIGRKFFILDKQISALAVDQKAEGVLTVANKFVEARKIVAAKSPDSAAP